MLFSGHWMGRFYIQSASHGYSMTKFLKEIFYTEERKLFDGKKQIKKSWILFCIELRFFFLFCRDFLSFYVNLLIKTQYMIHIYKLLHLYILSSFKYGCCICCLINSVSKILTKTVMNSQSESRGSMPAADVLALLWSPPRVMSPTMITMTGRDRQSMMRLMGRWTGQSVVAEGFRFWAVGGFSNKKVDVKSINATLLFSLVFTWHLHFLLLSSLWRFATRVILQRVWPVSLYLCEIIR